MSFQEFTLIDSNTQTEVMADINVETGKIDGLYCYSNDIPVIYNYETDKCYKVNTRPGKNPLFVHIQSKARIFKLLVRNGFVIPLNEEDESYSKDVELLEKCLSFHGIGYIENLYY